MNLGTLSKDIWSLLFQNFEVNFDPLTLNCLSLTCKKLNNIDRERVQLYKNDLFSNYNVNFSKGRFDFVLLKKYAIIGMIDIRSSKPLKDKADYKFTLSSIFPDLFSYLKKLNVNTYEEMFKLDNEEICSRLNCKDIDVYLISANTSLNFLFSSMFLLRNGVDIVNAVMQIQNEYSFL